MWSIEKVRVKGSESDAPWFGQFLVSMGPGREGLLVGQRRVWRPPTDVYETDTAITVKIEVAGVAEDDLAVRLRGRSLVVAGCRDDPADKLSYHQMEVNYGPFQTEVRLPCDVDENDVHASYENGFLYILLPKLQRERKVPVVVVIEREG